MYLKCFTDTYELNGFDFFEAKNEIDFVLEILFNYEYKDFLQDKKLTDSQIKKALKIFEERTKTKRPIQQILGVSFFYGRKFFVNKYTLIPRPETELLVKTVLNYSNKIGNPLILDIGTGTGCIGLTLMLENPKIQCDMVDIQKEAIEKAKQNAANYNLLNKTNFILSDLFENVSKKYDIIVSNPPYIPIKDKDSLQVEVRDFDSPIALFTKDMEGLEFYKKIISDAKEYLNDDGIIAFEVGINQAKKAARLLQNNNFFDIDIIKDFNSIERIVTAKMKRSCF